MVQITYAIIRPFLRHPHPDHRSAVFIPGNLYRSPTQQFQGRGKKSFDILETPLKAQKSLVNFPFQGAIAIFKVTGTA